MANGQPQALKSALAWYVDNGVDDVLEDTPVDRTALRAASPGSAPVVRDIAPPPVIPSPSPPLGASDARAEAVKLAASAGTLEELRTAIADFEGIALKKTATNLVFCDGNPKAPVMLVGEAPGADEDRLGKPFVGVSGQLLDKIMACIGLSREEDDPDKAFYISNILNWRPPGNRTPSPGEIEASLPFIERHIQLAAPKILIFVGGVSAKALLGRADSISRMRKIWHGYEPQTPEFKEGAAKEGEKMIPAIATYHPAYLLRTPSQKKAVWADMLMVQEKCQELGLTSVEKP